MLSKMLLAPCDVSAILNWFSTEIYIIGMINT